MKMKLIGILLSQKCIFILIASNDPIHTKGTAKTPNIVKTQNTVKTPNTRYTPNSHTNSIQIKILKSAIKCFGLIIYQ